MKAIFIAVFITACISVKAQDMTIGPDSECGEWKQLPAKYTEWVSIDTIKKKPVKAISRDWVYEKEKYVTKPTMTLAYFPCGNPENQVYTQRRVCKLTGIIQERSRIIGYDYIEPDKTEYQQAIDSLENIP